MKKMFAFLLALLLGVLGTVGAMAGEATPTPAADEGNVPAAWNMVFETDDVMVAAKEACLIFQGRYYRSDAQVWTMGLCLVEQEGTDEWISLALYTALQSYDVSSGEAVNVSGQGIPVKLTFAKEDGAFRLLSYQEPEESESAWYNTHLAIFGESLGRELVSNPFPYARSSYQDAAEDAAAYLRFLTTGVRDGVWSEILSTGSDETACEVIHQTFIGWYPSCAGSEVYLDTYSKQPTRLYTVSIEGEQSYSGILTFDCYDTEGNRVEHCKFQVVDGEIVVLEGEIRRRAPYDSHTYEDEYDEDYDKWDTGNNGGWRGHVHLALENTGRRSFP